MIDVSHSSVPVVDDVLTEEMLKANFSNEEIRLVMGGNMMRYLNDNLPTE
ncbi:MAG: microsomal dipeptidase-like Zn-dependent dipeptidase [Enterobacterales bacterium]